MLSSALLTVIRLQWIYPLYNHFSNITFKRTEKAVQNIGEKLPGLASIRELLLESHWCLESCVSLSCFCFFLNLLSCVSLLETGISNHRLDRAFCCHGSMMCSREPEPNLFLRDTKRIPCNNPIIIDIILFLEYNKKSIISVLSYFSGVVVIDWR